jgi:hypothetical protein
MIEAKPRRKKGARKREDVAGRGPQDKMLIAGENQQCRDV